MARTHGYSKVMTGDSCTRLAIKLMTCLALGRGAFLAWDTVRAYRPSGTPRASVTWKSRRESVVSLVVQGRQGREPISWAR